jgi:ankyrin repeat protein
LLGIKRLITSGEVSADTKNLKGFHTLHIAAISGELEVLRFFLDNGGSHKINIPDWCGLTPLHYAANEGWADCLKLLLEYGADCQLTHEDSVCYIGLIQLYIHSLVFRRNNHANVYRFDLQFTFTLTPI